MSPNLSPVETNSRGRSGRNDTRWNVRPTQDHSSDLKRTRSHNPKVVGSNPTPATIEPGQRPRFGGVSLVVGGFYRVFYRVEVGRSVEQCFESARGFGLHARQHVLIRRHREAWCGVPESFADDLDRDAGFEQQGGVGVAQVV